MVIRRSWGKVDAAQRRFRRPAWSDGTTGRADRYGGVRRGSQHVARRRAISRSEHIPAVVFVKDARDFRFILLNRGG
ncbi:MAG: hypothetical protein WBW51_07695, partial [Methyloceanibacter sp.]